MAAQTNLDVFGVSHTGHLYDTNIKSWEPINLLAQINDKIKYIEKHFMANNDFDVILVGHSIGCYIILEVLNYLDSNYKKRIKKAFLLMPTIERMSESPNGKLLTFATKYLLWLIYLIAYLCSLLPEFVQKLLINILFTRNHSNLCTGIDRVVLGMTRCFSCVRSALYMGKDEMYHVRKLNHSNLIRQNYNTILLYYGVGDRWCPLNYYYDMKTYLASDHFIANKSDKLPTILLDSKGLEHGFVIHEEQCFVMANTISEWIKLI